MSVLKGKGMIVGIVVAIVVGSLAGFGLAYATFQSPVNNL
jgi:hypothetical protein